jgi:hypothetical protein
MGLVSRYLHIVCNKTIAGPVFAEALPHQTLRIKKLCGTEVMPIGDN